MNELKVLELDFCLILDASSWFLADPGKAFSIKKLFISYKNNKYPILSKLLFVNNWLRESRAFRQTD